MKSIILILLFLVLLVPSLQAQVNKNTIKKPTISKPTTAGAQLNQNNIPILEIQAGENKIMPGDGVRFSGKKPNYTIHVNEVTLTAGEGLEIVGEYPHFKVEQKKHKIGEEYLGGIVFYVNETGTHGLVAGAISTGTWTTFNWEYYRNTEKIAGYTVSDDEARITPGEFKTINSCLDGIGSGKYNTLNMIINDQKDLNIMDVGEEYSITFDMADKFPNWYIPSFYELRLLYEQRKLLPHSARSGVYWSSTEGYNVKRYEYNGPRGENLNRKYLDGFSNVKVDLGESGVTGVKCIDFTNGLTIQVAKTYAHKRILIREF